MYLLYSIICKFTRIKRNKNNNKKIAYSKKKTTFLHSHSLYHSWFFSMWRTDHLTQIRFSHSTHTASHCIRAIHASCKKIVRDISHFADKNWEPMRWREARVDHALAIEIALHERVRSTIDNAHSPTSGPVSGGRLAKSWKLSRSRYPESYARDRVLRALCRNRSIGTGADRGTNKSKDNCDTMPVSRYFARLYRAPLYYRSILIVLRFRTTVSKYLREVAREESYTIILKMDSRVFWHVI